MAEKHHTHVVDTLQASGTTLPARLRFVIQDDGGLVEVPGYDIVTIGRDLDGRGTQVDLAAYDAARLGVSRRHVEIRPVDGKLMRIGQRF